MRVRFTRRSQADVRVIFSYLDERSPRGAQNVKRALKKAVELIGNYPHVGRLSGEQDTRVLRVGRYPYLVYWSVERDEVLIVHIRHAARRPWQGER
jgi:toxin ParE1/3/4